MRSLFHIMILMLAAALFLQNTCPHGSAGRSSVLAGHGRCAMKQGCRTAAMSAAPSDDRSAWRVRGTIVRFPLFLFDDPHQPPCLEPSLMDMPAGRRAVRPASLLPVEILKPPAA